MWSDVLGEANWCHATGVSGGGSYPDDDPNDYCDNSTYQDQTSPVSMCLELAGLITPDNFDAAKGNMRLAKTSTSPSVLWKLPSRWDWQLAAVNGIRHVLPNIRSGITATTGFFWSSTLNHYTPMAWAYSEYYGGSMYAHYRNECAAQDARVICLGVYSQ